MNANRAAPGARSIGQTFLIGPEHYLRAIELTDSHTAPVWQSHPFPKPAAISEDAIKTRLEGGFWFEAKEQLLVACRRSDDRPVGSVALGQQGWRYGEITISLDPLMSEERRDQITAELLELLIPYTLNERNMMVAEFVLVPNMPRSEAVASRFNAKLAVRMREFRLIGGKRRDEHWYQTFNPVWLDLIGIPDVPGESPVARDVRSPAGPSIQIASTMHPPDAMVVGDRVVLRPFRPEEASLVEEWSRRETEIHFEHGRSVFNAHAYGHAPVVWARQDPPEVVCFAIARRDNDELIGSNGLHEVDWVHRTAETVTELYRPEHRGAGLGTEAKHLLLEYAFDRLDMHMVHSYVSHTNPRSAAALRKQGYRDAGSLAWATLGPKGMNGEWVFDLLASEWRAARDTGAIA